MNEKILSIQDCETLEEEIAKFNESISLFYQQYDEAIKIFESDTTVQSLYESGNYGINLKEHLQKVRETLKGYYEVLTEGPDSLVNQTKKYISNQRDLLMKNSRGYTATESIKSRREGNQG